MKGWEEASKGEDEGGFEGFEGENEGGSVAWYQNFYHRNRRNHSYEIQRCISESNQSNIFPEYIKIKVQTSLQRPTLFHSHILATLGWWNRGKHEERRRKALRLARTWKLSISSFTPG